MNRYPMKPYMDQMAQHGRYGDSMLVHMNPAEVEGIASLVPGGKLTINPVTGQPEAFLQMLAPFIFKGLGLTAGKAALATGALTAAVEGDLKKGILSGVMSYGLGQGMDAASEAFKGATQTTAADVGTERKNSSNRRIFSFRKRRLQQLGEAVTTAFPTTAEEAYKQSLQGAGVVTIRCWKCYLRASGSRLQVPASFTDKLGAGAEGFASEMANPKSVSSHCHWRKYACRRLRFRRYESRS
jgi:hypothetical protein